VASSKKTGFIIVSHSPSIIKYIKPDKVYILVAGAITKSGDAKLALETIKKGYFDE